MKTIIFHPTNPHNSCRTITLLTASCGSYQNSSYYDTDGIYGNTYSRTLKRTRKTIKINTKNTLDLYETTIRPLKSLRILLNDYNLDNDQDYPGWGSNPRRKHKCL
jgi:hypothetical protein